MKKLILITIITLFFFASYSQNNEKKLKPIRTNYSRINAIKNWEEIKTLELDDSTEGGEAKYYFSENGLEKVVLKRYGETGEMLIEYYLIGKERKRLSFVYEVQKDYKMHLNQDNFTKKNTETIEIRSYFYYNQLFKQMDSKESAPFSKEYLNEYNISIRADFIAVLFKLIKRK